MKRSTGWSMRVGTRLSAVIFALLLGGAVPETQTAFAARERSREAVPAIPLRSQLEESRQPLTTEQVWVLEPGMRNPQRATWVLDRDVQFVGLRTESDGKGRFRAVTDAVESHSTLYFRRSERVAPSDRLKSQAMQAAKLWEATLSAGAVRLSALLSVLRADEPELALALAQETLLVWKRELEQDWFVALEKSPSLRELFAWKTEWRDAPAEPTTREVSANSPEALKQGSTERWRRLMARAPARFWDGVLSIHADIDFGGRSLSGRFLFDTGQARNVVSPAFLQAQGLNAVLAATLKDGGQSPIKLRLRGEQRLAHPMRLSDLSIGGTHFALVDFLVTGTDFFGPPEYATPCCDGVIGFDFIRDRVFEVIPDPLAPRLNVWMREGYAPPPGFIPVDAYQTNDGTFSSDCRLVSPSAPESSVPVRVQWNTGQSTSLRISSGASFGSRKGRATGRLECGGTVVWESTELGRLSSSSASRGKTPPLLSIGMGVLGRGPFIVDASHGWLWLKKEALSKPVRGSAADLGLELDFDFAFSPLPGDVDPGDRILSVRTIRKGSPAEALERLGLRPGMRIASIDGKAVGEWNPWKLEERFREAAAGKTLSIEWWEDRGSGMLNSNRPRGSLELRKTGKLSVPQDEASEGTGEAVRSAEPSPPKPRG